MPELMATIEASREEKKRNNKFLAALQGIDLEAEETERTFDDVKRRARIKAAGGDPDSNDIVSLQGRAAEEEGFGIGHGLGYEVDDG